jgi:hypothetical protein
MSSVGRRLYKIPAFHYKIALTTVIDTEKYRRVYGQAKFS